jgi:PEGA domain-containing protein
MKRMFPRWSRLAMAVLIPVSLLALPAAADAQTRGGSRGGGGRAAGGGGGSRAAGGGGGQRAVGTAVPRGDRGGSGTGSAGKGTTADNAAPRGDSGARGDSGEGSTRSAVPPRTAARDGSTPVGRAVPRSATPPASGGGDGRIIVPGGYGRYSGYGGYGRRGYGGYYPWGFGGLGLGGYYGGYYDPYDGFYDPYGGYYGPYGGYSSGGYSGYPQSGYASGFEGKLRLKVKPRDAAVSIDGYYVGLVDDFDGVFQRLRIEAGMHRVEISAPGYEPLSFDVRIEWDQTVTYHGELRKLP